MIDRRAVVLVVLVSGLAFAACSSGAGNSNGDASAITAASCMAQKVTLLGNLEGTPVDVSADLTTSGFQQGTTPYTYDVMYAGGTLHVQWNTGIAYGQSTTATGTVVMPAGAPHAGETICGADGSIIYDHVPDGGAANYYAFTLTNLSLGPGCPATPVAGSLAGCGRDLL